MSSYFRLKLKLFRKFEDTTEALAGKMNWNCHS